MTESTTDSGSLWKGWRDDPIKTVAEDRLRRAPIAERAARLIKENHSAESSVVYGLEGPWGSGKSSVIALINHFLAEPPDNAWRVVTFTPWATSSTEGLFAEFFAALSTIDRRADKRGLREMITSYAEIARPLASLIPVAGTAVGELATTVAKRLEKPWNVAFSEIATALRDLNTPVLVVVDDIDRLQPTELLDLLKVVRLLGRFPGVDFLLAYDEKSLVETLRHPGRGPASKARARAFMEKIVQYPLTIPPLLTSQIVAMLDAGLTEIITPGRVEDSFDKRRFGDVILNTMPRQLTTPRAIERFLAQVREQFRAHDLDEIDGVDLVLATFLRVQFPDVFSRLQSWKSELTRVASPYMGPGQRSKPSPDWDNLTEELDDVDVRRDAIAVLGAIFPAVREEHPVAVRPGRFAHRDYFDRYLAQAIPEGDIPDAAISEALDDAAAGRVQALRALLADADEDRVSLAVSKLRARYPDLPEVGYHEGPMGPVTVEILAVAMTLVGEAGDDRRTSWTSTGDQLRWWASALLRQLLDANPATAVDDALLRCAQAQRRAHVIATAARDLEGLSAETRKALEGALEREAQRLIPMLLSDLRQRDASTEESGSPFLYGLVADSTTLDKLRNDIAVGLAAGEFTIADVAARFVGFSYMIGGSGRPSAASFSGEVFSKVTGVSAKSIDHRETGEWTDVGWPRRREFAAQALEDSVGEGSGDSLLGG